MTYEIEPTFTCKDVFQDTQELRNYTLLQCTQSDLLENLVRKKDKSKFSSLIPRCDKAIMVRSLLNFFPFINIMRCYNIKTDLVNDIVAGLIVGFMQLPQGLAYALLAALPPVYGLYTSVWPPLIYFFFGTSKHISTGTLAIASIMISKTVNQFCDEANVKDTMAYNLSEITGDVDLLNDFNACKIGIATTVSFMSGIFQLVLGIAQMGWIAIYFSKPLTSAFTTAAAVLVIVTQMKTILGVIVETSSEPWKVVLDSVDLIKNIRETNIPNLINTVIFMIILIILKEYFSPWITKKIGYVFPSELFVVIFGTILSVYAYPLKWNIQTVGNIPKSFPSPEIPTKLNEFKNLIPVSIMISLVCYANTISLAKIFSSKHGYKIDPNQEFIAAGIKNTFSSFMHCFISGPSLSRSAVFESSGAKTQVAGVVSSLFIVIVLLWAGPLFEKLPRGILACIIVVGLKNMLKQITIVKTLWNIDKIDLSIWIVTFFGTIFLNVDYGIIVGVMFNMLTVLYRIQTPHTALLGQLHDTELYDNIKEYQDSNEIEGIKIFRLESSLFFVNKDHFLERLYFRTGCNPQITKVNEKEWDEKEIYTSPLPSGIFAIILDLSMMSFIDSVGVSVIEDLLNDYDKIGIDVYLTNCHGRLKKVLKSSNIFAENNRRILYLTNHEAVEDIKKTHLLKFPIIKDNETESIM